jgi:hypothetical protein
MTREMLVSRIKTLEMQLAVLRAEMKQLGEPTTPYYLGDLEGILAGLSESSEEEIEAAQYRVKWDDEERKPSQ